MENRDYGALIRPLPEPTFLIGRDNIIIAANPAALALIQSSGSRVTGSPITDLIQTAPEKISRYLDNCRRSAQFVIGAVDWRLTGSETLPCRCEGALIDTAGAQAPDLVMLRCQPKSTASDRFLSLNKELNNLKLAHRRLEQRKSTLEDEIKARTTELAASEARCRAIVEAAGEAIITLNSDGKVQSFNHAASNIFGYRPQDVVGSCIAQLLPMAEWIDFNTMLQQTPAQRHTETARFTGQRKDHSTFPMELSLSRATVGEQQVSILIIWDISERLRSQQQLANTARTLVKKAEQLERTNRELDQFAYVTSHDLKAPLRAIANLSHWLEEDLNDKLDDDTRKQMNLLRNRVHRMESLIDGILEYSRAGRLNMETESVETEELIAEVVDSLQPPPGFEVNVATPLPTLEAPRIWLQQVFANLVSNAIKYNDRPDGKVSISTERVGDYYSFSVSDNGPGIAKEYHDKIFVIFQTLDARDKRESTGIGLTIVKKIIEEVGGRIWLESEAGKGAKFRFLWPLQRTLHQDESP